MVFRGYTGALCVATALLLALTAQASKKKTSTDVHFEWEPVEETDWNVKTDSAAGISDAVMLFEKVDIDDVRMFEQKCYRHVYQRVRILNTEGRLWAEVPVPFIHPEQKLKDVAGHTILRDGTMIEMTNDMIHESTAYKTEQWSYKQKIFSIPGVTDDCIIEYQYTCFAPSASSEVMIQKDIPLLKGEYDWKVGHIADGTLYVYSRKAFDMLSDMVTPNYFWANPHGGMDAKALPNWREANELVFKAVDVPPFKPEPQGMPDSYLKERLIIYYGCNDSPTIYWRAMDSLYGEYYKEFCKKNKRVTEFVKQFEHITPQDEQIDSVFRWVSDSIVNVSYAASAYYGLNAWGKRTKADMSDCVDDVLKKRRGDAQEITHLFCNLLNELGIAASPALAKDRSDDLFISQVMSLQFDCALAAVPEGERGARFYAPGLPCTPPGIVPWYVEGVMSMVAGAAESLTPIGFSPSARSQMIRMSTFKVSPDLDVSGTVDTKMTGQFARGARMTFYDQDTTRYDAILREAIAKNYPNAQLDSVAVDHVGNAFVPLDIHYTVEYPRLSMSGDKVVFNPLAYLSSQTSPFVAEERKGPIAFQHACQFHETATFELPDGWTVEAVPDDNEFHNQVGQFGTHFMVYGNILSVQRLFTLETPYWQPRDYRTVKRFYDARQQLNQVLVVLTRTGASETSAGTTTEE